VYDPVAVYFVQNCWLGGADCPDAVNTSVVVNGVGLIVMEVNEGELQLAIGSTIPISISAFNKVRSNIDDLQGFQPVPAPLPYSKAVYPFPPLIVHPLVAKPPNP
jgi:hypothetical protein